MGYLPGMRPALRLLALGAAAFPPAVHAQTPPAPIPPEQITVVATSPLLGSGIPRDSVPAETTILTAADLTRDGAADLLSALNEQAPGVSLSSASGNPNQPSLLYHGFNASPLQGTEQGLAVYVNGARFNQPFGDTVNWDVIPDLAIARLNLEGSNPVFGLNALGGALNVALKNGFTSPGGEADLSGGSFGQIQAEAQYGAHTGSTALYVAASELHQAGWRDLQSSDIQNAYTDLGWRNAATELHANLTLANSTLNGPGTSPVQLLAADPAAQFTAPNTIANTYLALNLNGVTALSATTSIQAVAYYQYLLQRVENGNAPNDTPCPATPTILCSDPDTPSTTTGGALIQAQFGPSPFAYSELDRQTTNTNAYGTSLQFTSTAPLFGRANHLTGGASFDGASTEFTAAGTIGGITPITRIYIGPGTLIDEPGTNIPVRVAIADAYAAAFVSDTFNLTQSLALTASARFNNAEINLTDQRGGDLTGQHSYNRANPALGATQQLTPWLSAYAGYAEANRAPTQAELSCASPADSCSLANFFTGDPNLKQVVARTIEAGLRGTLRPTATLRATYTLSLYRSDLDDDIAFINSPTLGRAYFQNIGQTRRQGIDAALTLHTPLWRLTIEDSITDATTQSTYTESAGSNPAADANGNITIHPGDRLPNIPANQLKLAATLQLTPNWQIGGTTLYQSGQYLTGDEANLTPRLPGFVTATLTTTYQLTKAIQLFGQVQNLNNAKYYTYGTFSPTSSVFLAQAPGATNPRSYSPAAPVAGYAGVRVTF